MYFVYVLANKKHGTLYIGVTNDLVRRCAEHRMNVMPGFTSKHGVHRLVYYEAFVDIALAIQREKQLKKWNRMWKIRLVNESNPEWRDLFPELANDEISQCKTNGFPPSRE